MAQAAAAAPAARLAQAWLVPEVQAVAVVPSSRSCLREQKCLLRTRRELFRSALGQVVRRARASRMRERQAVILAGRAVTLHSARLLLRMAAEAVAMDRAQQRTALAVLEVASGQKEIRPALRQRTARAEGVVVAWQQE